jgi:hypothetical protein
MNKMLRIPLLIAGSLAIVAFFFFGTLFAMDWWDQPPSLDRLRADHITQIKTALEAYRGKMGHYPAPFPDKPLSDVEALIGTSLPRDPRGGANEYRYVSPVDGSRYGLLFHLRDGATCITGVGFEGTEWWNAPACK